MVELGRRNRSCTASMEVIDKPSKDDSHERKGLWTLAEGKTTEEEVLFASFHVPSRRQLRPEHRISAVLCRVPSHTSIASTLPGQSFFVQRICILHAAALTYHVRGISSTFLITTCCA